LRAEGHKAKVEDEDGFVKTVKRRMEKKQEKKVLNLVKHSWGRREGTLGAKD